MTDEELRQAIGELNDAKAEQKEWVGLTDEEIHTLYGYSEDKLMYQLIRAAEDLLRGKNT